MKKPHNALLVVLNILSEGDFEIVSYGLAPNPNGFCYEFIGDGKRNKTKEKRLSDALDELTPLQEKILKSRCL